jgi:hypothetical protein
MNMSVMKNVEVEMVCNESRVENFACLDLPCLDPKEGLKKRLWAVANRQMGVAFQAHYSLTSKASRRFETRATDQAPNKERQTGAEEGAHIYQLRQRPPHALVPEEAPVG